MRAPQPNLANQQASGILEAVCQALELSETQFKLAEQRYTGVGEWLSDSEDPRLGSAEIFPQGSMALGTTVRPLDRDEFDIDLVCHIEEGTDARPQTIKDLVGDRLRSNGHYAPLLSSEKPRCWRLDYANEFHMDITPSIPAGQRGAYVPDNVLGEWMPTNPRGYKAWFESHASVVPSVAALNRELKDARADIDNLPQPTRLRGPLKRIVQLCKRHRDVWARDGQISEPPISVIITTLAAKSYHDCATKMAFDNELELVQAVVRSMPDHIHRPTDAYGNRIFYIPNETNPGENFAERWNRDATLADNFYRWHYAATQSLASFQSIQGLDQAQTVLSHAFGDSVAASATAHFESEISGARTKRALGTRAGIGLTTGTSGHNSMPTNTFYGR